MTTISAKTVLRSRNLSSPRKVLSTLLCRYPRWIHAEGRTHRLLGIEEDMQILIPTPSLMQDRNLSRNAASSRAIPVEKMIQSILDEPCEPLWWGKNVAGMQAPEELTGDALVDAKIAWRDARDWAIRQARTLAKIGAHKQIVNRVLEPYMHITVLVSATEWDNFLDLRDHDMAEPHIRMLAQEIKHCLVTGPVQDLQPGEWHLPFADNVFDQRDPLASLAVKSGELRTMDITDAIKLSTARCASTSYKTVDGFDMTLGRAIELHDKFVTARPLHASPMEHVAQADQRTGKYRVPAGHDYPEGYVRDVATWANPQEHGNFVGFRQYRHQL